MVTPLLVARPLRLLPFRALGLTPSRIGDPASMRAFTRPYRGVPERLRRWESRHQLVHDALPAVYLHEYTADGITVRGLVGALDISRTTEERDQVAVHPHEGIHSVQVAELADRMAQMQLNPAPILLVHRGTEAARDLLDRVRRRAPEREFTDRAAQQHRVWAVRDSGELDLLTDELAGSRALIADGHHRYAAYLRLRRQQPGPATDAGLAMLVDQDDTPLHLGAIHRLLGGVGLGAVGDAAARAGIPFRRAEPDAAVAALAPDTLVVTDAAAWATLTIRPGRDRTAVEILHEDLLPRLERAPRSITYHHTAEETLTALAGRRAVAVLMPAPDFAQVLASAAAHRLLPEKATSFQPKPHVGVLIRSLRDG